MQENKVVIITGCESEIGRETALEFAKLGYRISICGLNNQSLSEIIEEMARCHPLRTKENFLTIIARMSIEPEINSVISKTVERFGRIDILVNNSCTVGKQRGPHNDDFFEDFQTVMKTNLTVPVKLAHLALPYLSISKGIMINVSSICDQKPEPTMSYKVSKTGLSMLTKCFANALDGTGIRSVAITSGPLSTAISKGLDSFESTTDLNRRTTPTEISKVIVFLTEEEASFIHGTVLEINGGSQAKFNCQSENIK